jgi:hypothetical protein
VDKQGTELLPEIATEQEKAHNPDVDIRRVKATFPESNGYQLVGSG